EVSEGKYQCLPVHPTQLYSSANALFLCLVFYLFWRKFAKIYPGTTLGLLLILYGLTRFVLESVRDDNPYEHAWWAIHDGWTISQNIGIYLAIVGLILMIVLFSRKPVRLSGPRGLPREPEPSKAPASPYNGTAPPATVNPEPSPETANPPQKPDMPAEPLDR
ncbi:MAG: prolipoprotein diacylglyceryl transferase, partial [Planctomycetes bacterium]|nr:prolipoprotein diacylglyceryl transferase [Planctomycetota bacterium]